MPAEPERFRRGEMMKEKIVKALLESVTYRRLTVIKMLVIAAAAGVLTVMYSAGAGVLIVGAAGAIIIIDVYNAIIGEKEHAQSLSDVPESTAP